MSCSTEPVPISGFGRSHAFTKLSRSQSLFEAPAIKEKKKQNSTKPPTLRSPDPCSNPCGRGGDAPPASQPAFGLQKPSRGCSSMSKGKRRNRFSWKAFYIFASDSHTSSARWLPVLRPAAVIHNGFTQTARPRRGESPKNMGNPSRAVLTWARRGRPACFGGSGCCPRQGIQTG